MAGPPSLFNLAQATLLRYMEYIEDLGFVPIELISNVFENMGAEQLAHVEDCTWEGSSRDLAPLTWPYWLNHLTAAFGAPQPGARLPPLPITGEEPAPPPQPGVPAANYRQVYEQRVSELEMRREVSGKRLRQLWEQEAYEKKTKQIQVIDPLARKRRAISAAAGASLRTHYGASQPAGTRDRLLKKLKLSSGAGKPIPAIRAVQRSPAHRRVAVSHGVAQTPAALQRMAPPALRASLAAASPLHQPRAAPSTSQRSLAGHAVPMQAWPAQQQPSWPFPQSTAPQQQQQQRHRQPTLSAHPPAHTPRQPHPHLWDAAPSSRTEQQPQRPQQQQQQQQQQRPQVPCSPASSACQPGKDEQLLGDPLPLDELLWLQPSSRPGQQPKQQTHPQKQHWQGAAARPDAQGLLDEPAWLPPATGAAAPKMAGAEQQQSPASPASAPSCTDWLDEVTWLPPAPKAKPLPAPTSAAAGAPNGNPASKRAGQHCTSKSSKASPSARQPQGSAKAAGGQEGNPKLTLPPPQARTVSALKKAMQFG